MDVEHFQALLAIMTRVDDQVGEIRHEQGRVRERLDRIEERLNGMEARFSVSGGLVGGTAALFVAAVVEALKTQVGLVP